MYQISWGNKVSPSTLHKNLNIILRKNSDTKKQEWKRYKMHNKEQTYLVDQEKK
jgi:hypothetical protein